jgi:precorrin-6Y C5,15-methyltransferase (decarboxylating)
MCVLERLGMPDERITRITPDQAQAHDLCRSQSGGPDAGSRSAELTPALFPGMPDHWFAHEKGLITKAEVRAVSLSRLRLFDRAIFWDLGAGSGSVSVEAGLTITRGTIYTVEQKGAADRPHP